MEKSTSLTFLYYKTAAMSAFQNLVDITSYPEIFTKPEKTDISTLASNQKKYTKGMVDLPDYDFGMIYNKDDYAKIKALESDDTVMYQLRFGSNGEFGMWQWTGGVFVTPSGGDVGSARTGTITCYPSTDVAEISNDMVIIGSISDQSIVVGTNKLISVNYYPVDATLSAASSDVEAATVSVSGGILTIVPVADGTTVITLTGTKSNYTTGTETFTVTVSGS